MKDKKTFSVNYSTRTHYESIVTADNKKEAIKKVKNVIGADARIEQTWEVKPKK